MKPDQRLPVAADYRNTIWGVHPETLLMIAAVARGDIRVEELPEDQRPEAAVRGTQTTGGVALIPLRGLITPRGSYLSMLFGGGTGGLCGFRQSLQEAVGADDIASIVIDIDSPGGSTDLVSETAADIRAARAVKPVVAVANTWAASAAYWLAAQADELVVTPSGEVGSIGVFQAHEDWSKFEEEFGVTTTLISAGKYKTEGNRFEPLSDEAREAMQAKVDSYYDLFVADVAKGRGASANAVRNGYGEGRMVTAKQAVELGMADRADTLEATIAKLVKNPRRARRAEVPAAPTPDEGNPAPNASKDAEEATARPSEPYIDLMVGSPR